MKLIYHHRTQARGAEGVHIFGVVAAFRELGHRVEIVCPPGVRAEEHAALQGMPMADRQRAGSSPWKWLSRAAPEWLFEAFETLYALYSYFALLIAARRLGPDLIYDRYALFDLGPALVSLQLGIPLVTEFNDATVIRRTRPLRFHRLARAIEGFVLRNSTLAVTVSEKFRELLVETHGAGRSSMLVTPNAVDPSRFDSTARRGLHEELGLTGKCVIGVVGGFVPWHGLDFLVDSVEGLLATRKDAAVLLVGDGPVRPAVERQIAARGLADRVRFTGFVPARDVPDFIAVMDVCLMPDSNVHGSPLKIFEYMAMGKPVVAPRYRPIEEVIEDGGNGMLFRPRDAAELARVIGELVDDPDRRRRMGQEARRRVLAEHTWRRNVESVLAALSGAGGYRGAPLS